MKGYKIHVMDEKGFLSLFDGLLAILIMFIALIAFNSVVNMDISPYSKETNDFSTSNDVMEVMALRIHENSYSILELIEYKLKVNNNSLQAIDEVSLIAGEFLNKTIPNKRYCLIENNQLNGTTIVANNDIQIAENISSSTRTLGNYSFTLYIW